MFCFDVSLQSLKLMERIFGKIRTSTVAARPCEALGNPNMYTYQYVIYGQKRDTIMHIVIKICICKYIYIYTHTRSHDNGYHHINAQISKHGVLKTTKLKNNTMVYGCFQK